METTPLTLITIVAEHVLKDKLIEHILHYGARGYTLSDVEGQGSRHRRVGDSLGANIKLEVIVHPHVADKLLTLLSQKYFPRYALIVYTSTVHVIRGEKYV